MSSAFPLLPDVAARPADSGELEASQQPRSLFGEILDWMLAPLLLLWPLSIAATYLVASSIANVAFDHALEYSATILAQQVMSVDGRMRVDLPIPARELLRVDGSDRVYWQVVGPRGERLAGNADLPLARGGEPLTPGVVQFRSDTVRGDPVRIAYLSAEPKSAAEGQTSLVIVAETLSKRTQLANEIIKGVILPQFVFLPIAVVLVWLGLSRGIRPLSRLQHKISTRAVDDMRPIDPREAPQELAPLVDAFNQLLSRLERNILDQKRFIADAAHQMRTPLAGLRTQAELALRENDQAELKRSLQQIATGSIRATRLINQLLSLARAENRSEGRDQFVTIELESLARDVVQDWVPAAMEKRIDLGFEGVGAAVFVSANVVLLRELLKNLLDNAIRYTPLDGAVTVRVCADALTGYAILEVEDNGPGIQAAERDLVFERFYRILGSTDDGSGLGLAIVREIAQRHRAEVVLASARLPAGERGPGTSISVRLIRIEHPVQHRIP